MKKKIFFILRNYNKVKGHIHSFALLETLVYSCILFIK